MFHRRRQDCFCAFCRTPRRVYKSKNLGLLTILGLVGFSFVLTHVFWGSMDPRGLGIVAVLLMSGELLTQIKWRQSTICQNCGFDPVVYRRDPERAGLKIKEFIEMRGERPEFLLKPALNISRTRKGIPGDKKGSKLSLQG